jgi:hypothetical protein
MGFDNPLVLWLFILLPVAILLWYWTCRYFRRFEQSKQYQNFLYHSRVPTWKKRLLVVAMRALVLSLVVLGLSQPFIHINSLEHKYKNVRLFFLLDVSLSMAYGEDVPPNRLAAAKKEIAEVYNVFDGTYESSIVPFAGDPNPYYCPLTYSRRAFLSHLKEVNDESAPSLGTDLVQAFKVFADGLYKNLDRPGVNIIILLSDGGKEESAATDRSKLFAAIQKMSSKNFKVYTVGIGGIEPTPLIIRDSNGNFDDYIRDDNKKVYYSELDEEILMQIASNCHGSYLRYSKPGELYPFIESVIKENRILDTEQQVEKKLPLESYCFVLASVLLLGTGLMNKRSHGSLKRV